MKKAKNPPNKVPEKVHAAFQDYVEMHNKFLSALKQYQPKIDLQIGDQLIIKVHGETRYGIVKSIKYNPYDFAHEYYGFRILITPTLGDYKTELANGTRRLTKETKVFIDN